MFGFYGFISDTCKLPANRAKKSKSLIYIVKYDGWPTSKPTPVP
jgi:hypothetical protein